MTVLFFVTILFAEVRPKVLCIHPKLIIVCRRLRGHMVFGETKRNETIFDPKKSDGWAALFFCNPIAVVIVLLKLLTIWTREQVFFRSEYQRLRLSNLTKISNSYIATSNGENSHLLNNSSCCCFFFRKLLQGAQLVID